MVEALLARGDSVVALSRSPATLPAGAVAMSWPAPKEEPPPTDALEGADAVVHLLGEPIAQRWTEEARREIRDSRVSATRRLVEGLASVADRPGVLVPQSASGYYGPRGDEPVDESAPPGDDFLADVTREWEAEALKAEELGVRVA